MTLFDPADRDPYDIVDPILMPWAQRHGIQVGKVDRDWHVRSIWLYDRRGNRRAQMWLELPDAQGNVKIIASPLDPTSPTNWGTREERYASLGSLELALEELWPKMLEWAGPGAFS